MQYSKALLGFMALYCLAPAAFAAQAEPLELDPFAYILVELGLIIAAVVAGHILAQRLALPSILGELLIGMVIGNLLYWSGLSPLFFLIMHLGDASLLFREVWVTGASVIQAASNIFPPEELVPGGVGDRLINILVGDEGPGFLLMGSALWHFSNLGILFLLFKVSLGVRMDELLAAGRNSLFLALAGMISALGLGWLVAFLLLPEAVWSSHFLLASGLVSTSASIAIPLLAIFEKRYPHVVKIVIGAILIDDVLAIALISSAATFVQSGSQSVWSFVPGLVGVALFFSIILYISRKAPAWELPWLREMDEYQAKLLLPLGLAFFMAWFANLLHLSSIMGIFGAGLILNSLNLEQRCQGRVSVQDLVRPLARVFAPIFFVLLGMQINLGDFLSIKVLFMGVLLTGAAIGAKLLGGFLTAKGMEGALLGWAMVPRGEVALIVVAMGKSLGVITDDAYAAFMIMVIASMVLAPLMLQRRLAEEVSPVPETQDQSAGGFETDQALPQNE